MLDTSHGSCSSATNEWPGKLLLTFAETGRALNCSPALIRKLVRSGRMKVVHLGRCVRIPHEEILRLCNVRSVEVENA